MASQEVLHHRENVLVRRQRLAPGEASPWHRDPFHRVTVVLSGDLLKIEFRDGAEAQTWKVRPGEVDWSEPSDRVHRAVNVWSAFGITSIESLPLRASLATTLPPCSTSIS